MGGSVEGRRGWVLFGGSSSAVFSVCLGSGSVPSALFLSKASVAAGRG